MYWTFFILRISCDKNCDVRNLLNFKIRRCYVKLKFWKNRYFEILKILSNFYKEISATWKYNVDFVEIEIFTKILNFVYREKQFYHYCQIFLWNFDLEVTAKVVKYSKNFFKFARKCSSKSIFSTSSAGAFIVYRKKLKGAFHPSNFSLLFRIYTFALGVVETILITMILEIFQ